MNIRQVKNEIIKKLLLNNIEQNEAKIEAEMLICNVLKCSIKDLILMEFDEIEGNLLNDILEKVDLRCSRKPIQQILGYADFMGEKFIVDENVLIPRDETEILVRKAVDLVKKSNKNNKTILEIGVGSGCISCMLAQMTDSKVIGVDISKKAIDVALKNVEKFKLKGKIILKQSDLFSSINDEIFDMIVSNPPYIPKKEHENLQEEVKYEPSTALFASDIEGVEFYDKIIKQAPKFLVKGGYLIFELGIGQVGTVKSKMINAGFKDIETANDLAGIKRVILGRI